MYDRLAHFYDWEHGDFQEDIDLYLGFARAATGAILDGACGTGRVLLPLAAAGYSLTGVDISEEMLAIARSRIEGGPLAERVELVRADLRNLGLGRSYGLALLALGSFHHLHTVGEQRSALQRLAVHLAPGGLLVIDLVNPSPEWLAAGDSTVVHQRSAPFPGSDGPDLLSKFVARTTHFETQTERILLIYDRTSPEGALERRSFQLDSRFLFRYEMELLLAETGFRVRGLYGSYDLESYQAASPRMIFVVEKR